MSNLMKISSRFELLKDLHGLKPSKFIQILYAYWQSYVGTFVWGHSGWSGWHYFVVGMYCVLMTTQGIYHFYTPRIDQWNYWLRICLYGSLLAALLLAVFSAATGHSFVDDPIFRDSFSKARLTAPIGVSLVFFIAQISDLETGTFLPLVIRTWLAYYGMTTIFIVPTGFYFADLF